MRKANAAEEVDIGHAISIAAFAHRNLPAQQNLEWSRKNEPAVAEAMARSLRQKGWCPRGLERPNAPAEAAGPKKECASEKSVSPSTAPQNHGNAGIKVAVPSEALAKDGSLGLEMAEIVSAWPKLPPEIRVAILTLLRTAKIG